MTSYMIPDTVEELLALAEAENGVEATFWALTDDEVIVACERFSIWEGEGDVLADVFAEGFATRYRVECRAIGLDWTAQWDDRIGINAEPGDRIHFRFTLHSGMLR